MELRNIQKTGGSSYNITLPKSWIKSLRLTEKDSVEIFFQNKHQLGIRPHIPHTLPTATLIIDHLSKEQVVREIIAHYLSGVSEISIQTNTMTYEVRSLVRTVSHKLVGFEIFDTTGNKITLKNVSTNTVPVKDYAVKMTNIISSMYEDIEIALLTNNKMLARDIVDRDVEVDRIELIMIRQLNILLYSLFPTETSDLFLLERHYYEHIAIRLERIADHVVRIANTFLQLKEKDSLTLTKPEKDRIKKIHKYFLACSEIIANLDKRKAHELLDNFESIDKNDFINKKINNKASMNILIEDSVERIRSYIANIAEETIDYFAIKKIQPFT
ncbi:MAG: AbrB/MazE/SpoVT family DNA-binding domain-containing protein [Patescibacteria group bacterium]|nr:AbrB/MazE/SpoVT family DNA-binding domain-containing protein [Patescibacteria group bacterium]